jgi:hypothetical protein
MDADRRNEPDNWADDSDVDSYDYAASPGYFDPVPDEVGQPAAGSGTDEAGSVRPDEQDDDITAPIVLAVSVTNAAGTVTATATISGWLQRIELEPQVTAMDEAQLAREIVATAELARLKGQAGQRTLVQDMLTNQGADQHTARDYVDQYMNLPTPEQAADAEAEANARYLRGEY